MRRSAISVWMLVGMLLIGVPARGEDGPTRLLRFPDAHGDQAVFTYAGDLWTASTSGGVARRITTHPGLELFPHFSPDGSQIAFTGQYDGDEQVYVVDTEGGEPRQLTYYPARGPLPDRWGFDHQVYGWTPDGDSVLFRSNRHGWSLTDTRLYTVSVEGGLPEALPMKVSGAGDLSPDGTKIAFTPLTRDFRTWKRYEGGWAQDLWIFDLQTMESQRFTEHPRTDRDPMWIGDRVYFASDRDGKLNLYVYDTTTGETEQITQNTVYDIRWPNRAEDARIVYEENGTLHLLELESGESRELDIRVPTDAIAARPRRISVSGYIESFGLSPDAKRALFVARGDIFTVPVEQGTVRNLTRSSGAHDKWATWSPDGARIAFISDRTGEEELYVVDRQGGEPTQLTDNGDMMRFAPMWSPDSKRLAFGDKSGRLFVLNVETREMQLVADDPTGTISDATWSPKGGHLAFSLGGENGFRSIYIWSLSDGQLRRVTGELFNEFEPVWDTEGKYLYYLSDREFAPQVGSFEWNYVVDRETGIFVLALRKDVPHPFPPQDDETAVTASSDESESSAADSGDAEDSAGDSADDSGDDGAEDDGPDYVEIDFDGLAERVARVPAPADNYNNLNAVAGHLIVVRGTPFYYGRSPDIRPEIQVFSLSDREMNTLVPGAAAYTLSADRKKILVAGGGGFNLYNVQPKGPATPTPVSVSNLYAEIVPREEWDQIFHEIWRRFRDYFYVENMHGYDWDALREQYEPLLEHVAHRSDLNYVIGEMIGELNVGHAYNAGGDYTLPDRPDVALPGAIFKLDPESGRYRLAEIFQGHNEEAVYRAPLREIGVNVEEGDYVLAIDGEELTAEDNPYRMLRYKSGQTVTLTVNGEPTMEGAREIQYQPITSENDLVYLTWITRNREYVERLTEGRVGYIHLPNMGAEGIREFNKWFYGQTRREGMVVDVRNNGGGNVSQMILNRLARDLLATRFSRNNDFTNTYPGTMFFGHLVCVLDENSASDGDIFPAMFREAGLGPLIGKRSWGGVTGITNRGTLIDGGSVNVPEFGFASADGQWIIEGYGVDPDIEVDNDPTALVAGRDPQLDRAIREVLQRMSEDPRRLPNRPPAPIKTD